MQTIFLSRRLGGGAQLGKAGKGRSIAKQDVNEEEKRLLSSIQRMEMMDYMHRLALSKKTLLKDMLLKEEQMSRTNQLKIQSHWRQIMRSIKVDTLRKEVNILSQNFERDLDRKDAIIQMLDRDSEQAEQQFLISIRSHFTQLDDLIDLQDERLLTLEKEFENEMKELEQVFSIEKQNLIEQHERDMKECMHIMNAVEVQEKEREAEARQEHEQHREEIRNKNSEEFNVLRIMLDSSIEELEQHFETAHLTYLQNTDQRTQDFKYLTNKDQDLSRDIDLKVRKIERLQNSIAHWRTKIAQNGKEGNERNEALEKEKKIVLAHFRKLKGKMTVMRNEHRKALIEISDKAFQAKAVLDSRLTVMEKVLKLGEIVRKLEVEEECVSPFGDATLEEEKQAEEMTETIRLSIPLLDEKDEMCEEYQPQGLLTNGKVATEWDAMTRFWRRTNKVILDELVLRREKLRLESENNELQGIVKQLLDGNIVNGDIMSRANSLLVIKGQVDLFRIDRDQKLIHKSVIDANHMIQTNRYNR